MVAVALSAEVRPPPLDSAPVAVAAVEQQGQVGGTEAVNVNTNTNINTASTGIGSVDDHIARLKANARQHVDRDMAMANKTRECDPVFTLCLP